MDESDVFRGQVLSVKVDPRSGSTLEFVERPDLPRDELILPDGVLDVIERHIVGPTRHRDALLARGRHLSRGLLLWDPPGTGKTHTVRYLTGLLTESTVIVLSGSSLGAVEAFAQMARRLTPSVVVLEDVDLVAQERTYGPFGSSPVLFELMNQMDGLDGDADIAFVLTTNRPDALEPALAARPGRVDLAVELPLPDEECRRRLIALYSRGLELQLEGIDTIVARMSGVTASFVKEVLRKAVLHTVEDGRSTVTDVDMTSVLDEPAGGDGGADSRPSGRRAKYRPLDTTSARLAARHRRDRVAPGKERRRGRRNALHDCPCAQGQEATPEAAQPGAREETHAQDPIAPPSRALGARDGCDRTRPRHGRRSRLERRRRRRQGRRRAALRRR
jgi:hypothetical protein